MSGHRVLVDRIMLAVQREPAPTPTRALATALRRGRVRDATASVWVAWHLATVQRPMIAPGVRARSLALVIAVVLSLGSISVVAAATARAIVEQAVLGSGDGRPTLDGQRPAPLGDDGAPLIEALESEAPSPTEPRSTGPATIEDDGADDVDRGDDQDDAGAPADDGNDDRAGRDGEDDAAEPADGDDATDADGSQADPADDTEARDESSAGDPDSDDTHADTTEEDSGWIGSSDDE